MVLISFCDPTSHSWNCRHDWLTLNLLLYRAPDKVRICISLMPISSPNPMFDHLLESSRRDDSNRWSNIGFGQEITRVETIEVHFTHLIWSSDRFVIECLICEVIGENPAYGGAGSVFLHQPFPYAYIYRLFLFNLCRKREKCFLQMLIRDKKSRLWSNAAQNVLHLIRSCPFCSSISCFFPDGVTYIYLTLC